LAGTADRGTIEGVCDAVFARGDRLFEVEICAAARDDGHHVRCLLPAADAVAGGHAILTGSEILTTALHSMQRASGSLCHSIMCGSQARKGSSSAGRQAQIRRTRATWVATCVQLSVSQR
jgi:hypothetical protein